MKPSAMIGYSKGYTYAHYLQYLRLECVKRNARYVLYNIGLFLYIYNLMVLIWYHFYVVNYSVIHKAI